MFISPNKRRQNKIYIVDMMSQRSERTYYYREGGQSTGILLKQCMQVCALILINLNCEDNLSEYINFINCYVKYYF